MFEEKPTGMVEGEFRQKNPDSLWALAKHRFDVPLSCLGLCLYSVWTELGYTHAPIIEASVAGWIPLVFDGATVLAAIAVAAGALLTPKNTPLARRRAVRCMTLFLLLAAVCLNYGAVALKVTSPCVTVPAAIGAGVAIALLFVMWWEVVSRLNPFQVVLVYAAAGCLRVALIWMLSGLSFERLWIAMLLVSLAAIGCLRAATDAVSRQEEFSFQDTGRCAFPLAPLVVVVMGAFCSCFVLDLGANTLGVNGNPGMLVACLAVLLIACWKGEFFNFNLLWQLAAGYIAFASFGFIAWETPLQPVVALFAAMSHEMMRFCCFAILANLVYRYAYNATFLFAIQQACSILFGHIGSWSALFVGASVAPSLEPYVMAVLAALAAVLFIGVTVKAFATEHLGGRWASLLRTPLANDLDLALEKTRLGMRCREVAQEYRLSHREEEVLLLIMRGEKPAAIAKELFIKESTISTHRKHIYQKLDVHSFKELRMVVLAQNSDGDD